MKNGSKQKTHRFLRDMLVCSSSNSSRSTMNSHWMGPLDVGEMSKEDSCASSAQLLTHQSRLFAPQTCSVSTPKSYESTLNKISHLNKPSISGNGLAPPESLPRKGSASSSEMPIALPTQPTSSPIWCPGSNPASLSAVDESFLAIQQRSRNWRHRSLPNLFEPHKKALTVSPTTSIHCSHSPSGSRAFIYTEAVTGLDIDLEATSEITLDDLPDAAPRRKTLVRKQFSGSDNDSDSKSSSSSSLRPDRKRAPRRPSFVKRLKPNDSNCCYLTEADIDESISSAGELERFFDSMGLDDQIKATSGRSLQIQVSDDAMESDEEEFESVSIVGLASGGTTDLIPSVETDDDDPVPESSSTAGGSAVVKMDALPAPFISSSTGGPSPAEVIPVRPTNPGKNHGENISLRNARIYKWLVNCRAGQK